LGVVVGVLGTRILHKTVALAVVDLHMMTLEKVVPEHHRKEWTVEAADILVEAEITLPLVGVVIHNQDNKLATTQDPVEMVEMDTMELFL
jgi:hypothetical protein